MQLWEEFALPSQYVHVLLLQVTSANELSFNHQRIQPDIGGCEIATKKNDEKKKRLVCE